MGIDPFQHLLFLERLANVVDAAGVKCLDLVVRTLKRADEDDGNIVQARVLLELSADLQAGHLRHEDVQQHKIRRVRCCRLDSEPAAGDRSGLEAAASQNSAQKPQALGCIVHNQDVAALHIIAHFCPTSFGFLGSYGPKVEPHQKTQGAAAPLAGTLTQSARCFQPRGHQGNQAVAHSADAFRVAERGKGSQAK